MEPKPPVQVPPQLLDAATLRSVIEEFVSRDGTEFSDHETKIREVRELLERGEVQLWFDPDTGSCTVR
ncbi:MAG: YheU family protein [Planctomycetes bacterium]|nr:YheU family protein [Planctomycetota bacterium]